MNPIRFDTHPDRYKHWKLEFDGPIARLNLDVAEDGGLHEGYKLKLNSYDLGVDVFFKHRGFYNFMPLQ